MRVVAEVPSSEMDETRDRKVMGMSSSNEKRVACHELAQSMLSSLCLDDKTNVSVHIYSRTIAFSDISKTRNQAQIPRKRWINRSIEMPVILSLHE